MLTFTQFQIIPEAKSQTVQEEEGKVEQQLLNI
jgi:hypothetical protein